MSVLEQWAAEFSKLGNLGFVTDILQAAGGFVAGTLLWIAVTGGKVVVWAYSPETQKSAVVGHSWRSRFGRCRLRGC